MKIGYARVSTQDQKLALQTDALKAAGCEMIFEEKISGKSADRPKLSMTLDKFRKGDTLVLWKLDRLGRSLKDLIEIVTRLQLSGIAFSSLQDNIDTNSVTGRFAFHLFTSSSGYK